MKSAVESEEVQHGNGFPFAIASVLVALVALVYWPVHQNWFVWDDKILIHDNAWLSAGNGWLTVVLHGFPDWAYFRPLGLALFVAEIRWFGINPGPMHLVSLLLHLINTSLVGALAWRLLPRRNAAKTAKYPVCVAMLAYGLHPVLVEPIAWIASQFDLLVTMAMLAGLLLNLTPWRTSVRATAVAICFFIAACCKESALAFPILVVLLDWLDADVAPVASSRPERLRAQLHRQWPVYLGIFMAGIAYLAFRFWAKSGAAPMTYEQFVPWERFQGVCHVYLIYWRMTVWPFVGLAPQHIIATSRFAVTNSASLLTDLAVVAMCIAGVLLAWRRNPFGILIVGATALLFPVLHVVPIGFDESLYHERYAAPAIALACALLPAIYATIAIPPGYRRIASAMAIVVGTIWLSLAALAVRTTIPLWSDDIHYWEWALRSNPDSVFVMDSLLDSYIQVHDTPHAMALADLLMSNERSCANCMLNVANLALTLGDVRRGAEALRLADAALSHSPPTHHLVVLYVMLNGNLHQLEHDETGAEEAYRGAISIDPMRPEGYISLALSLARQGKSDEARKVFDEALSLAAPDQIDGYRALFQNATAEGAGLSLRH